MNEKEKRPGVYACFTTGVKKGCTMFFNACLPSVIIAFVLIRLMTMCGLMDVLGKLLGPFMAIFGLPGEAAVPMCMSILAMSGGVGSAAALVETGVLSAAQAATMMPFMFLSGGIMNYSGRIMGVTGIDEKYQKYVFAFTILAGLLSLPLMRVIMMFV